jgi:hypothetical protein
MNLYQDCAEGSKTQSVFVRHCDDLRKINGIYAGSVLSVCLRGRMPPQPIDRIDVDNTLLAKLMGNLSLLDATGVDRTPGGQKARALIGLLAMTPDRRRPRRWLEQKLWSDRSPEQASSSLRQVLMELRTALGPVASALQTDRQTVELSPLKTDLDSDPEGVRLSLAAGFELMQNVHVRDTAFAEWLRDQRARMAGTAPLVQSGWQPDAPSIPLLVRTTVAPSDFCGFVALSLAGSIGKLVSDYALVDVYAENTAVAHLGPRERGLALTVPQPKPTGGFALWQILNRPAQGRFCGRVRPFCPSQRRPRSLTGLSPASCSRRRRPPFTPCRVSWGTIPALCAPRR